MKSLIQNIIVGLFISMGFSIDVFALCVRPQFLFGSCEEQAEWIQFQVDVRRLQRGILQAALDKIEQMGENTDLRVNNNEIFFNNVNLHKEIEQWEEERNASIRRFNNVTEDRNLIVINYFIYRLDRLRSILGTEKVEALKVVLDEEGRRAIQGLTPVLFNYEIPDDVYENASWVGLYRDIFEYPNAMVRNYFETPESVVTLNPLNRPLQKEVDLEKPLLMEYFDLRDENNKLKRENSDLSAKLELLRRKSKDFVKRLYGIQESNASFVRTRFIERLDALRPIFDTEKVEALKGVLSAREISAIQDLLHPRLYETEGDPFFIEEGNSWLNLYDKVVLNNYSVVGEVEY